jgi:hypothetical protein
MILLAMTSRTRGGCPVPRISRQAASNASPMIRVSASSNTTLDMNGRIDPTAPLPTHLTTGTAKKSTPNLGGLTRPDVITAAGPLTAPKIVLATPCGWIVRQFPEQKVLSMTLRCTTARIVRRSGEETGEETSVCWRPTDNRLSREREATVAVLMLWGGTILPAPRPVSPRAARSGPASSQARGSARTAWRRQSDRRPPPPA